MNGSAPTGGDFVRVAAAAAAVLRELLGERMRPATVRHLLEMESAPAATKLLRRSEGDREGDAAWPDWASDAGVSGETMRCPAPRVVGLESSAIEMIPLLLMLSARELRAD